MILLGLFAAELLGLYLISRWLTQIIYLFFYIVFRSRAVALSLLSLLLFPGTVIHELSHLFTAEILGVRTGKLSLIPESISEHEVRAGSVQIASTDPFRRYLIGFAPIIVGTVALFMLTYWLPGLLAEVSTAFRSGTLLYLPSWYILVVVGYFIFTISNTMFSSKEDTKGFLPFAVILGLFMGSAYLIGLRLPTSEAVATVMQTALFNLVTSLGIILAINCVLLLAMKIVIAMASKILKITIHTH